MIHTDPALHSDSDQIADAYNRVAASYDRTYQPAPYQAENRLVTARLARIITGTGQVVDLGCGTGWLLDQLPLPPDAYLGVDISPGMLARARAKYPAHRFLEQDMADQVVDPGSASTVVSTFGAFNYHPRPRAVLSTARQALRRGGALLLVVYSPGHAPTADCFAGNGPAARPWHPDTLTAAVRIAGFHLTRLRGLRLPSCPLPVGAPGWLHGAYLALETATVGRLAPARAQFLLLEARAE
jgi:SAM-dependent methyltransferase